MTTAVTDSYITTIEDFETRLTGDPRSAAIALLAEDNTTQTWYLQRASKNIDQFPFIGYKYLSTQTLEHPRKFIVNPETDSPWGIALSIDSYGYAYDSDVPELIKAATVEEAIGLYSFMTSPSTSEESLQAKGIASFSLGKLSMSFVPGSVAKYGSLHSKDAYDILMSSDYVEMAPLIQ